MISCQFESYPLAPWKYFSLMGAVVFGSPSHRLRKVLFAARVAWSRSSGSVIWPSEPCARALWQRCTSPGFGRPEGAVSWEISSPVPVCDRTKSNPSDVNQYRLNRPTAPARASRRTPLQTRAPGSPPPPAARPRNRDPGSARAPRRAPHRGSSPGLYHFELEHDLGLSRLPRSNHHVGPASPRFSVRAGLARRWLHPDSVRASPDRCMPRSVPSPRRSGALAARTPGRGGRVLG